MLAEVSFFMYNHEINFLYDKLNKEPVEENISIYIWGVERKLGF